MQLEKKLLAKWSSRGGKYWVELYAELGPQGFDLLPGYSYKGEGCGGYIGTVAPEVALQHAAQQASYSPSQCPRVFYSEAIGAECSRLWCLEMEARAVHS